MQLMHWWLALLCLLPLAVAWDLDTPVYRFNKKGDGWTIRDLCTGMLVLGGPGSGKSSCLMSLFRMIVLSYHFGGMVLCVKPGEARTWLEAAERHGRTEDIIHVTKHGPHCFDPLMWEMKRGNGGGDMNNVATMFSTLVNVGKPHVRSGDSNGDFFTNSVEQVIRHAGNILIAAGEPVSIHNIRLVINSAPDVSIPDDPNRHTANMHAWMEDSYLGSLIPRIVDRREAGQLTEEMWRAADYASDYFLKAFSMLAIQTKTSIVQTFSSMADKLMTPPYDRLLCGGKLTWCPEQMFLQAKVILLDVSTLEHGASAELLQVGYKLAAQRAIARRNPHRYPRPCFIFADEFQVFSVPQDADFQEICREARGCVFYATQNLQNVARRLQEHKPGSGVFSLVGNIQNRIMLQCGEEETVKWFVDSLGKQHENVPEMHGQHVSIRQDYRYKVEPATLTSLQTPTKNFPYAVGCVYRGGQLFEENEEPYLFHAFGRI